MNLKQVRRGALTIAALLMVLGSPAHANESPLVTTEWLEKNIDDPKVRVIEVSVEPGQFERGHIPGAQNIVWHTDLVDTVKRDIASQEKFQNLLRKLGVEKDSTIVLYGDNNNWFAAWGAWVFSVYGLDNVKLLDGGRRKWETEKRPLLNRVSAAKPSSIEIAPANPKLRARLSDVLKAVEDKDAATIVDIRSAAEFSGKVFAPAGSQELSVRAGHVPGAVNVTWSEAVNPKDGTFKSAEELRKLYASKGVDGSKPIIVYCRIGERSSHTWFLLSRILGYDVRNYDGSWTEYGNSVGVPVTNLAGTVWGGR